MLQNRGTKYSQKSHLHTCSVPEWTCRVELAHHLLLPANTPIVNGSLDKDAFRLMAEDLGSFIPEPDGLFSIGMGPMSCCRRSSCSRWRWLSAFSCNQTRPLTLSQQSKITCRSSITVLLGCRKLAAEEQDETGSWEHHKESSWPCSSEAGSK